MDTQKAMPFIKWQGGKQKLLPQLQKYYPNQNLIKTYVEPFLGGGAMLLHILQTYKLNFAYACDKNENLVNTWVTVKSSPEELIAYLKSYENKWNDFDDKERRKFYSEQRNLFNTMSNTPENKIIKAVLFIFLNKTCYNGVYRVNSNNQFNVPIGQIKHPNICDEDNIRNVSALLNNNNVVIECKEYPYSERYITNNTFVYLDPPYKPLDDKSFNGYTNKNFDDDEQIKLKNFIDQINVHKPYIMLSNSDPQNTNKDNRFFVDLYAKYNIHKISANRSVGQSKNSRKKVSELLITNY